MSGIVVTCRQCGAEFTPDRLAILRGVWRTCPACRGVIAVDPDQQTRCTECGCPLRARSRTICARCLGVTL